MQIHVFFMVSLNHFAGGGQQRVRAKLYGALLYYLQIAHKPKISMAHLQGRWNIQAVCRLLSERKSVPVLSFALLPSDNIDPRFHYHINFTNYSAADSTG